MATPTGVLLLNFGGPANLEDVAPFLRSLLGDPAVIGLPWPLRVWLARLIARRRAPIVIERYRAIGGGSPLARSTAEQAAALAGALGEGYLVSFAFRHSPPFATAELERLADAGVREVVALPLYPQWSASTSGSALAEVHAPAHRLGLAIHDVPSFPAAPAFVDAVVARLRAVVEPGDHVIVAAHGLPERAARAGDSYVTEVRATFAALAARLPEHELHLAFQSRLGPVRWTRPYLDEEVRRAGVAGVRSLVVAPVSFVAENLETLYELDIELAEIATAAGIARFRRAATVGCHPAFIALLAELVRGALGEATEKCDVA